MTSTASVTGSATTSNSTAVQTVHGVETPVWKEAEWWTAGGTVFLAIVTAVLAVYTYRLWRDAREDSRSQADATKEALAISQRSAAAAVASADALLASERAYLFVEIDVQNVLGQGPGFPVELVVKVWNYGRTPAEMTAVRADLCIAGEVPQQLLELEDSAQTLAAGVGLASQIAFPVSLTKKLTDGERMNLSTLATGLYCVGKVDYRDMFGAERTTSFCCKFVAVGKNESFIPLRESRLNART